MMKFVSTPAFQKKVKKALSKREKAKEKKERDKMKPQVRGQCRVLYAGGPCGGNIVETFANRFTRPMEEIPIGPGSSNYVQKESQGMHCKKCGLQYAFVSENHKR